MNDEISNIVNQVNKFKRTKELSNGDVASIKLIPATKALGLAKKLLAIIAPAVGGTLDGLRHDEYLHGAPKSFTDMALTLVQQLDNAQIENIIMALTYGLEIKVKGSTESKEVEFDDYFTGNYGALIEIVEFSLRENFSTFFTGKGIKARFLKAIQMLMMGMESFQEE